MDDLKSMALTPEEAGETEGQAHAALPDLPKHPYGLELSLDHSTMGKLGMEEVPKVGDEYHVIAKGRVTHAAEQEQQDGSSKRSARVQITHMAAEPAVPKKAMEAKLYGKGA